MIYTLTLNPALDRELLVPDLSLNTVLRAAETRLDYGGKGFNVSRALLALGVESTALGFVGGNTGLVLQRGLESLGILTDFIQVNGETRTNVTIVEHSRLQHIKVNEPGPLIQPAEIEHLAHQVQALARPGDWFVLSGSLPPGVSDTFYGSLIRMIHASGARPVLDSSGHALQFGCQAVPYLVKPNAVELAELTGRRTSDPVSIRDAASELLVQGIAEVVVSLGKDGALLFTHAGHWQAAAPEIVEQNPIGAGDAMLAGLVYALNAGLPSEEVLTWGIACGAAAAAQPGTGLGTLDQVQHLAAQVRPYPLD